MLKCVTNQTSVLASKPAYTDARAIMLKCATTQTSVLASKLVTIRAGPLAECEPSQHATQQPRHCQKSTTESAIDRTAFVYAEPSWVCAVAVRDSATQVASKITTQLAIGTTFVCAEPSWVWAVAERDPATQVMSGINSGASDGGTTTFGLFVVTSVKRVWPIAARNLATQVMSGINSGASRWLCNNSIGCLWWLQLREREALQHAT